MRSFQISQGLCILKLQATLRDNTSSYEMYFRGLDQLKKTTVISCTKTTLFKKSLHWRVRAKGVSMLRQAIRITTCNQKPILKNWENAMRKQKCLHHGNKFMLTENFLSDKTFVYQLIFRPEAERKPAGF